MYNHQMKSQIMTRPDLPCSRHLTQRNRTITGKLGYQRSLVDCAEVLQQALGVVDGRVKVRAGLQPPAIQIFCHQ